jgi:flagellar basal body-associated protein FliL
MKAAKGKATRAESEEAILAMASKFKLAGGDVAAPKKSFKMLIFVAIALIVVGAGAGGAWMFLMQPPDAEAEAVEAPPEVFAKAYVQTDAVHIGFTDRNGGRRRLVVFLTLEVEQRGRNVADVQQAMPRLQEAFWRSLNGEPLP